MINPYCYTRQEATRGASYQALLYQRTTSNLSRHYIKPLSQFITFLHQCGSMLMRRKKLYTLFQSTSEYFILMQLILESYYSCGLRTFPLLPLVRWIDNAVVKRFRSENICELYCGFWIWNSRNCILINSLLRHKMKLKCIVCYCYAAIYWINFTIWFFISLLSVMTSFIHLIFDNKSPDFFMTLVYLSVVQGYSC